MFEEEQRGTMSAKLDPGCTWPDGTRLDHVESGVQIVRPDGQRGIIPYSEFDRLIEEYKQRQA